MKVAKGSIGAAVERPDAKIRLYLFYGPAEAQSRALAARLLASLGAVKFALTSVSVKSDPASLLDAAGAMNLFGERRAIWIEPAGSEIEEGVASLLDGAPPESPVVAIAGSLSRSSALLKLAEGSPLALSYASYIPEGADAQRMVSEAGRRFGLKIAAPLAARLADSCGGDEAIAGQELAKFALYLDASPHSPKELDGETVDLLGADGEGNFLKLGDLALRGDLAVLAEELTHMLAGGSEAVPVIRSLQRRLAMLAPARSRVERGESADSVMASLGKSLFWKDKPAFEKMLTRWSSADLARIAERAGRLERELMRPRARPGSAMPEEAAVGEELLAIAHRARAR
ncbi:MAG TPA: DNA polymerase III subunit delta [Sphingomicrobium sp.]|nr:DNA polymerase III subunit delta [Sphingomicrobium sp.]